jgi:hypothetical protein
MTASKQILLAGTETLSFDPRAGKFKIATCNTSNGKLDCATWAEGLWPQFVGRKLAVIQTMPNVLLLDFDEMNGDYRVWELHNKSKLDDGVPLVATTPIGFGSVTGLIQADVTWLEKSNIILSHQSFTSTTSFFKLLGGILNELPSAIVQGVQVICCSFNSPLNTYRLIG